MTFMTVVTFGFAIGLTVGLVQVLAIMMMTGSRVDDWLVVGLLTMIFVVGLIVGWFSRDVEFSIHFRELVIDKYLNK